MVHLCSCLIKGGFKYQFNAVGTFYYWSGLVDSNTISFRGIVEVVDGNSKELDINVKLNGINGKIMLK